MLSFARVRALAIVSLLLIGALVAVYMAMTRDDDSAAADDGQCPPGSVAADLTLPEVSAVQLNVYNGTDQAGLASQIGENFANRDFEVLEQGNDPLGSEVDGVAVLRYGPAAVGTAHVVQAYFLNSATPQFDIEREGEVVDVVIGKQFRQLATETEVRQSIAAVANRVAVPPPGTCRGPAE